MKLVKNARTIAWKSFSMWAGYISLAILIVPEILFYAAGIEVNPRGTWGAAFAVAALGLIGRITDQGIDR